MLLCSLQHTVCGGKITCYTTNTSFVQTLIAVTLLETLLLIQQFFLSAISLHAQCVKCLESTYFVIWCYKCDLTLLDQTPMCNVRGTLLS